MPLVTAQMANQAAENLPFYTDFVRATDQRTADEFVKEIFSETSRSYYGRTISQDLFDALIVQLREILPLELRKVQLNRGRIFQLYRMASGGQLSQELLQQEGIDRTKILDRPSGIRFSQLEQAAQWVIDSSTTNQGTGTAHLDRTRKQNERIAVKIAQQREAQFIESMWKVVSHNNDVTSIEVVRFLNSSCGHTSSANRRATGGSKYRFYGGETIGRYLHLQVASLAASLRTRANRYPVLWYDIAVFMMIGYIICHGFKDGNGRAARSLYCCTLVQKRLHFIRPSTAWQNKHIASQYKEEYGHPMAPS